MSTASNPKSRSDIWYDEMFAKMIGRLKSILKDSDPVTSAPIPENFENNPKLHIYMDVLLDKFGASFPLVEGVEILKHQIRKDLINWIAKERPSMIASILEDNEDQFAPSSLIDEDKPAVSESEKTAAEETYPKELLMKMEEDWQIASEHIKHIMSNYVGLDASMSNWSEWEEQESELEYWSLIKWKNSVVKLHSLKNTELNGAEGIVISTDEYGSHGRLAVSIKTPKHMAKKYQGGVMVKIGNLVPLRIVKE